MQARAGNALPRTDRRALSPAAVVRWRPRPGRRARAPSPACRGLACRGRPAEGIACRNRPPRRSDPWRCGRSEEHTSELQSQSNLVCRLLLEKKKKKKKKKKKYKKRKLIESEETITSHD